MLLSCVCVDVTIIIKLFNCFVILCLFSWLLFVLRVLCLWKLFMTESTYGCVRVCVTVYSCIYMNSNYCDMNGEDSGIIFEGCKNHPGKYLQH